MTGVIKLADFGLAKTLEYGASLAESFCGTLDFIAPERMTGRSDYIIPSVWVYSVNSKYFIFGSEFHFFLTRKNEIRSQYEAFTVYRTHPLSSYLYIFILHVKNATTYVLSTSSFSKYYSCHSI